MDGFMGAGVHAFGAKKPKSKAISPKGKGVVKTSPKKGPSPAKKTSPAKKANSCACSCKC